MQLLKLVAFLMFSFLSSYSFYCLFWSFPRTCPGRCDALQSWICLRGWSCSLLLMLKSEPNRLFKMSWTKSKLPVSLQSGKTELFWCKFTLIPPQGMSSNHYFIYLVEIWSWFPCGNLISFIHLDEEKTQHLSSLFEQLNTSWGNLKSWRLSEGTCSL